MASGQRSTLITVLAGAAAVGAVVGIGSAATTPTGREGLNSTIAAVAKATGGRQRAPQPGDDWRGCNDARAAGTTPILRGEPGYRSGLDGDGDGVACEPYSGSDRGGGRGRRRRH